MSTAGNEIPSRWAMELRSPRLRAGLAAIAGIVWLYGVLELEEVVANERAAWRAASTRLARLETTGTDAQWMKRAQQANESLARAETMFWRESTIGLAQAALQDWIAQAAQQAGIPKVATTVAAVEASAEAAPSGLPPRWKVTARISFDFDSRALQSLLARIAANPQRIDVESLTARASPAPRTEMVLVAYFIKPNAAPSAAAATPR